MVSIFKVQAAIADVGHSPAQVGMATTFEFYAFPDRTRLRLSQIFVPPPHQHRGVGRALLLAVYVTAVERDALDVTVSPSTKSLPNSNARCSVVAVGYALWFHLLHRLPFDRLLFLTQNCLKPRCGRTLMWCMGSRTSVVSHLMRTNRAAQTQGLCIATTQDAFWPCKRLRGSSCLTAVSWLRVQVEDPAPQLKTLRDRLDLQRLAALPWLTAHAERVCGEHTCVALAPASSSRRRPH